ncbi:MAG: hypothetical protein IJZ33_08290 [Clostridia bacterium]|nr:hypothetical protein [Clostridia bacterium]
MKKLLLIPVIIFPYLLALGVLLGNLFPEDIAPIVFGVFIVLFALATPICNIVFMILSRKDDPNDLIRAAFLVKLVHIPAYIVVFVFGVIAAIMIFMTLPLILMLILFDCIVLFFSSSISVFALAKNIKNNKLLSVVALICQFFFCADIISLFVLWIISKNQGKTIST